MNILIIGGTVFLGRHITAEAIKRGHNVTLFNRGMHFPDLFPEAEKIRGDRAKDLALLDGRTWDVVIDTPGQIPSEIRATARTLADRVEHYTFISSISVYPDLQEQDLDEDSPVMTNATEADTEMTHENYGALKALCEKAAEEEMPGRTCSIRPGLIVGPYDFSDRFPYWPRRVARGGRMLVPGAPDYPVQVIDTRDLASWTVDCAERRLTGVYNATGPDYPLTMGDVIDSCLRVSGSDAEPVWMDDTFLLEREVGPWMELPLWIPQNEQGHSMGRVNCSRAIAEGLRFRPLDETVQATLEWDRTRPTDRPMRAGMASEREQELLEMWDRREVGV